MAVESPSGKEAIFLYNVFFAAGERAEHGFELEAGDWVFDIGADIGRFSASPAECHRDLRLVLFEPVPDTFAMLERNAERLLDGAEVTLVRAGVASEPGTATFEFDTDSSIAAGASSFLREIEES